MKFVRIVRILARKRFPESISNCSNGDFALFLLKRNELDSLFFVKRI